MSNPRIRKVLRGANVSDLLHLFNLEHNIAYRRGQYKMPDLQIKKKVFFHIRKVHSQLCHTINCRSLHTNQKWHYLKK